MSRKFTLLIIIVILLLILGGVFCWRKQPQNQLRKWWIETMEMKGSIKDFLIKEIAEGKIIENKKEGLVVQVPVGWGLEKSETSSFAVWGMNLFSPDISLDPHYLIQKGCMIGVNIENSNLHFNLANLYIQNSENIERDLTFWEAGYEVIEISQQKAFKELIYDDPKIGIEIDVRIPTKDNKNIYFVLRSCSEDKERCISEFNNFLDRVVINK